MPANASQVEGMLFISLVVRRMVWISVYHAVFLESSDFAESVIGWWVEHGWYIKDFVVVVDLAKG